MAKISIKEEELREKKFYKQLYIFLGFGCVLYYLFPFVFNVSYADKLELWEAVMRMLLVGVYPFYTFIACFLSTRKYGFRWYIAIILGVYFMPAAMLMFGYTALVYVPVYIVFGYFGSLSATMLLKRLEKFRNKGRRKNEKRK
ncbi:MAG: hypothetical protein E7270_05820 [Lachnospiraceae bacterium]|nr:hypothetical protein [Lachnospiraceae bacterium]MBQ4069288.1 hypothetical protein [Lachnospiraceae bacterium]